MKILYSRCDCNTFRLNSFYRMHGSVKYVSYLSTCSDLGNSFFCVTPLYSLLGTVSSVSPELHFSLRLRQQLQIIGLWSKSSVIEPLSPPSLFLSALPSVRFGFEIKLFLDGNGKFSWSFGSSFPLTLSVWFQTSLKITISTRTTSLRRFWNSSRTVV